MAKTIIEEFFEQISAGESVSISLRNVPINGGITFDYYLGESSTEKRTFEFNPFTESTKEDDRATVHFDGIKTFTITAKTVSGIQNSIGSEAITYKDPLQAYGFRGDKSKVEVYNKDSDEVYTKDSLVVLDSIVSGVQSRRIGVFEYSTSLLASHGIFDIEQWVPISIGQSTVPLNPYGEATSMIYSSPFEGENSHDVSDFHAFPFVQVRTDSDRQALTAFVFNRDSETTDVLCRIVMMKVL